MNAITDAVTQAKSRNATAMRPGLVRRLTFRVMDDLRMVERIVGKATEPSISDMRRQVQASSAGFRY